MSTCIILFVKNPVAGTVKTRLQPELDSLKAADLYRAFVVDCAETVLATVAARKVIAYSPADAEDAVRGILGPLSRSFEFVAQPEVNLGKRMAALFAESFARGDTRTVIMGSDSPSLMPEMVDGAFEILRKHELVIGPCIDGGYYLIGLRKFVPELFRNIEWSSSKVLRQTAMAAEGLDFKLLPIWYDVDTFSDAVFLLDHLEVLQRTGSLQGRHSLIELRNIGLSKIPAKKL